jgi:hypothetical protein
VDEAKAGLRAQYVEAVEETRLQDRRRAGARSGREELRSMNRFARAPLLHFVLLGGALFALAHGSNGHGRPEAAARAILTIPAAAIESERRAFIARAGRAPTRAEMAGLTEALVDDEVLWREAVALDLDRDDPVVRRRLVRNARFLGAATGSEDASRAAGEEDEDDGDEQAEEDEDGGADENGEADENDLADADADDLYAEALSLGLDRSDEVVRRRLVERMRLRSQQQTRSAEPTDAEIDAYVERNRARFLEPGRVGLTQVFLSRERRGERLAADAQELLARLEREHVSPADAARFGDPSPAPARLPAQSRRSLLRHFGPEFAERVLSQAPGVWAGPVPSAYGLHVVWVHEAVPPRMAPPERIRAAARELLLAERAAAALRATLERLRARYDVRVEP